MTRVRQPFRFEWEQALRRDPDLSAEVTALLLMMATHADPDGSGIRISQQTLANEVRRSPRSVRRHLTTAVDLGWLVVEQRGHRLNDSQTVASTYRLKRPSADVQVVTGGLKDPDPSGQIRRPKWPNTATQVATGVHLPEEHQKNTTTTGRVGAQAPAREAELVVVEPDAVTTFQAVPSAPAQEGWTKAVVELDDVLASWLNDDPPEPAREGSMVEADADAVTTFLAVLPSALAAKMKTSVVAGRLRALAERGWTAEAVVKLARNHGWDSARPGAVVSWLDHDVKDPPPETVQPAGPVARCEVHGTSLSAKGVCSGCEADRKSAAV